MNATYMNKYFIRVGRGKKRRLEGAVVPLKHKCVLNFKLIALNIILTGIQNYSFIGGN